MYIEKHFKFGITMKNIFIFAFLFLLSCQSRKNNPADVSAIHKWIRNYEEAIMSADIERILSGESESVIYFPPNQAPFSGKDNLRKWLMDYFNFYDSKESLLARDVKINGDIAYVSCNYKVFAKVKYSGEEFTEYGKLINIFRRERFNKWKCTYCVWNSNNRALDLHTMIPANFSGEWNLDLSRSTPVPDIISAKMIISQKGNNISIDRSYEIKGKDPLKSNLECTIGREIKSSTFSESHITESRWSPDKQSFTIVEKLVPKKGKEYKRTTVYSLTLKGESLNIISFDQLPDEALIPERKIEMIYNKIPILN